MMDVEQEPLTEAQRTDVAVEAATAAKSESVAASQTAEEAQMIAAQTAKETAEKLTSLNEFALKDVKDILQMQHQKMETLAGMLKESQTQQVLTNQELKDTLELLQTALGDVDEQTRKLVLATAALVKLANVKA